MMQNFLDLEEGLKDITSDLQKLKEKLSPVGSPEYSRSKERSFFNNMLDLNGKSKNIETIV